MVKYAKKSDTSNTISGRIKGLLESLDMLPLHLSQKTGIDNAIIYKCLGGKRKWNLGHLELIAPVLGVRIADLIQEAIMVPRVGGIKDGQGPVHAQILRPTSPQDSRPYRLQEDKSTLSKIYELVVEDRSLMPSLPPGAVLIVQRETADIIKNENFVVYWAEDGQTYVRQIFFDVDHLILRSLTQGIADKVLPMKHLTLCEKIIRIEFPS